MKEKRVKRTSEPKRKNDRKGSFPKCAGEQPAKPKKDGREHANEILCRTSQNEGKERKKGHI